MSKRRIYDSDRHVHFITFSCYRRRRLLDHDGAKRIVLGVLGVQLKRRAASCVGFVVMPDHVHALIWFAEANCLSDFMKQWKRLSSVRLRELFEKKLDHYGNTSLGEPIWQAKYYSFNVYSRKKLEEKLAYMHHNPVRAGLVVEPCDWRWSSARHYERGQSVGVKVCWVE